MASKKEKKRRPLRIGDTVYDKKIGPGYRMKWYPMHVRGFVDDHIVLRWWSLKRQYWMYVIEHVGSAEDYREYGVWHDEKPSG